MKAYKNIIPKTIKNKSKNSMSETSFHSQRGFQSISIMKAEQESHSKSSSVISLRGFMMKEQKNNGSLMQIIKSNNESGDLELSQRSNYSQLKFRQKQQSSSPQLNRISSERQETPPRKLSKKQLEFQASLQKSRLSSYDDKEEISSQGSKEDDEGNFKSKQVMLSKCNQI